MERRHLATCRSYADAYKSLCAYCDARGRAARENGCRDLSRPVNQDPINVDD